MGNKKNLKLSNREDTSLGYAGTMFVEGDFISHKKLNVTICMGDTIGYDATMDLTHIQATKLRDFLAGKLTDLLIHKSKINDLKNKKK